jgi:glycerophosphoryl diester phosphodiesterase
MRTISIPKLLARGLILAISLTLLGAGTGVTTYVQSQSQRAEKRLFGSRPGYFSGQPTVAPLDDYGPVFSVGHNAGASVQTTHAAIASGADVIEIDVVAMDGTLVSAHLPPVSVIGPWFYQGPTLETAWRASADAQVVQLDLKQSTPEFRRLLLKFLDKHAGERTIMVATADVTTLRLLSEHAPTVLRFLSVPDAARLRSLYADEDLIALIDGVTIRYQLVTAESVANLKALNLIVLAWTVNDLATVNQFVQFGVDGFSTNNLAIMGLLGGRQNGEIVLGQHRAEPPLDHDTAHETAANDADPDPASTV